VHLCGALLDRENTRYSSRLESYVKVTCHLNTLSSANSCEVNDVTRKTSTAARKQQMWAWYGWSRRTITVLPSSAAINYYHSRNHVDIGLDINLFLSQVNYK